MENIRWKSKIKKTKSLTGLHMLSLQKLILGHPGFHLIFISVVILGHPGVILGNHRVMLDYPLVILGHPVVI